MAHTVSDIAAALGAIAQGDGSLPVRAASEPQDAGPDELAIALGSGFLGLVQRGRARAALLPIGTDWRALGLSAAILVAPGRHALAAVTAALRPASPLPETIHPTAITQGAEIVPKVGIGAYSVISPMARIGEGARIGHHVTVGQGSEVGPGCEIHDGVRIGPQVRIGSNVVLHSNVVIGGDGFSFVTEAPSSVDAVRASLGAHEGAKGADQRWEKVYSLGGVSIGSDVEIGAGSTVDAGTLRATTVGDRTKIDNLVQIGHNVRLGADCLVCAQAGIAGSTVVGDRTVIGGKAGIGDNLSVGADVVLGGGTIVLANVPDGRVMLGYPAMPMSRQIESYKALRRLPRLLRRFTAPDFSGSQDGAE